MNQSISENPGPGSTTLRERLRRLFESDRRIVFFAWATGAVVFFRKSFGTGFDHLSGDYGDMRLVSILHEHWLNVFRLNASWNNPNFFYPQKHVLGYSDTFLLNELFYVPLRALGFDRYAALQWTLVLLSGVGFFGLYRFLSSRSVLPRWTVIIIVESCIFANAMAIKVGHPQMGFAYWLPWIAIFWERGRASRHRAATFRACALAGLIYGLVLYSGYYVGWFAGLAAVVFGIWYLIVANRWRRIDRTAIRQLVLGYRLSAMAFLSGFAVAAVPFALTYGPIAMRTPKKPWFEPMAFAPSPGDFLNVGQQNLVWRSVMRALHGADAQRFAVGEVTLSVTPLVFAAFVIAFWVAMQERRNSQSRQAANRIFTCLLTYATLRVLPFKVGTKSLWYVPYRAIPGAAALRAIDRIQIINLFVVAVATASAAEIIWARRSSFTQSTFRSSPLLFQVFTLLLVLAMFEQLNSDRTSTLDRSDELALLAKVPDPPKQCRSFFVDDAAHPRLEALNIDAMIIAQSKRLPTVNGYSGQFPKDYFPDSALPEYLERIKDWTTVKHSVTAGLCRLDRQTWTWSEFAFP